MQLVPKYFFLSDFDILNFIVFVRVKFHGIKIKVCLVFKLIRIWLEILGCMLFGTDLEAGLWVYYVDVYEMLCHLSPQTILAAVTVGC